MPWLIKHRPHARCRTPRLWLHPFSIAPSQWQCGTCGQTWEVYLSAAGRRRWKKYTPLRERYGLRKKPRAVPIESAEVNPVSVLDLRTKDLKEEAERVLGKKFDLKGASSIQPNSAWEEIVKDWNDPEDYGSHIYGYDVFTGVPVDPPICGDLNPFFEQVLCERVRGHEGPHNNSYWRSSWSDYEREA